jgi:SAM-dependent methyltransferase
METSIQPMSDIIPLMNMSANCCSTVGDKACCSPVGYAPAMLEDLPAAVTGLSLGCGDPVSIASLRAGETVIDLGSGGGIDCFLAARQVGPTGHVIGIDMTVEMLERANANKAQVGLDNVEFRRGQIEAMPVADGSADVIMSNCVINLSPDKRAVFAEAFRALKPGGRVSISDIVTEGEIAAESRAQLEQWSACITGAIDAQAYVGLMREVGFANVEIVDKTDAEAMLAVQPGLPRIYSARITASKP